MPQGHEQLHTDNTFCVEVLIQALPSPRQIGRRINPPEKDTAIPPQIPGHPNRYPETHMPPTQHPSQRTDTTPRASDQAEPKPETAKKSVNTDPSPSPPNRNALSPTCRPKEHHRRITTGSNKPLPHNGAYAKNWN